MRVVRKAAAAAANEPDGGAARKPRRRAQAAHQAAGDEISQQQQQVAMGGFLRVCSDCNTSKTPLWRSGPRGPKSLCNACGIRQRKARRAAANGGVVAAAAPASDVQAVKPAPGKKEKSRADVDRSLPFKKRCKTVDHATAAAAAAAPPAASIAAKAAAAGAAAPGEEDHDRVGDDHVATAAAPSPSKDAGSVPPAPPLFHGFPRDEITDAAMLLMTLSCGLVRS